MSRAGRGGLALPRNTFCAAGVGEFIPPIRPPWPRSSRVDRLPAPDAVQAAPGPRRRPFPPSDQIRPDHGSRRLVVIPTAGSPTASPARYSLHRMPTARCSALIRLLVSGVSPSPPALEQPRPYLPSLPVSFSAWAKPTTAWTSDPHRLLQGLRRRRWRCWMSTIAGPPTGAAVARSRRAWRPWVLRHVGHRVQVRLRHDATAGRLSPAPASPACSSALFDHLAQLSTRQGRRRPGPPLASAPRRPAERGHNRPSPIHDEHVPREPTSPGRRSVAPKRRRGRPARTKLCRCERSSASTIRRQPMAAGPQVVQAEQGWGDHGQRRSLRAR